MTAALVVDVLNMAAWTRRHSTLDGLVCHTDAGSQTHQFPTLIGSTTSEPPLPSAPSATATTMRWPNQSWGCSRPNCTATPPPWPTTAGPGEGSTTWKSPLAAWCLGSTTSGSTASSTTSLRPSSKPTTVTGLSPMRPENPNSRASVKPRPVQRSRLPGPFLTTSPPRHSRPWPIDSCAFGRSLDASRSSGRDPIWNRACSGSRQGVREKLQDIEVGDSKAVESGLVSMDRDRCGQGPILSSPDGHPNALDRGHQDSQEFIKRERPFRGQTRPWT